jgi:hypothetical protein
VTVTRRRVTAPVRLRTSGVIPKAPRRHGAAMEAHAPRATPVLAVPHVLAPLAVGGLLYLGLRSESLLMFRWADALGAGAVVHAWREIAAVASTSPEWVRLTLPDALWTYALAWTMSRIWRDARRAWPAACLVPIAAGPGAELAQWMQWLPGTFDPIDVGLTLAAALLGALAGRNG